MKGAVILSHARVAVIFTRRSAHKTGTFLSNTMHMARVLSLFGIDLVNLFLSPSFLKWMNACVIGFAGHSILALPMSIPTSFIDSFKSCVTSDSVVSLWNPVTTVLP